MTFCEMQLEFYNESKGANRNEPPKRMLIITTYKNQQKERLVVGPFTPMQLDLLLAGETIVSKSCRKHP